MVKGISRQVIVVRSPDPKLFEQAIFILRADAPEQGITEAQLLREARRAVRHPAPEKKWQSVLGFGAVWACGGAALTGLVWLLTVLL